jgi:hypothetical protein
MFLRPMLKKLALFPLFFLATDPEKYTCAAKNEIYIWGNGYYQARPDALLQFANFTPKLITNLPNNLIHLEFG